MQQPAEHSTYTKKELIALLSTFISGKGIEIQEGKITVATFFRGIEIRNGQLIVDHEQILYPGDLLHEAGHIAVTSPEDRVMLCGDATDNRPGKEGEEMSVMLWTWAACLQMNIAPEIVFHEHGYRGQSDWIVSNYRSGIYIGLPLFVWMGMAKNPEEPGGYPEMIKWLRE